MSSAARRWVVLVATLAAVLLTVRLGFWQLSRAAQKEALQQSLQTRGELAPVPMGDLARTTVDTELQLHRRTVLTGRWLAARTVFLENRQMEGRPGFFDAVVVQRGWAPRDLLDRTRLPAAPAPEGLVRVAGLIAPPPSALYAFGADAAGPLRQNLDMEAYGLEIGVALRPWSLQQQGDADDGLMRRWPAPAVDVHKHYGYAFQWFALAALLVFLYAWFQLVVPWRARRHAS
jgi:surfeit locus 1 family protein